MAINFGTWDSKYALGEKLFVSMYLCAGYSDNDINWRLNDYKGDPTMTEYQKKAEDFLKLVGGSHGGGSNALFGPIDRSKENTERMHAITLAMGADTGKHNHKASAYNITTVPIFIIKRADGTYLTAAGASTTNKEEARPFYSRADIETLYPNYEGAGWTIEEV